MEASPVQRRPWTAVLAGTVAVVMVGVLGVLLWDRGDLISSGSSADEPYYGSTAELEESADVIVRGDIVDTREHSDRGWREVTATIRVAAVAKGEVAVGTTVEVSYARPGSGPETPEELDPAGGEYVFLLALWPEGGSSLVNTSQGYYRISDGRAVATKDNPVPLGPEVRQRLGLG
ncbi:hypothetical protein [Plantactinospora sonchi]|uniref:Uncharacterized protein n=1 Tax=Plantactinospora sonchi TaxID=1544735 RepID=A0ABU7RL70_9ACTN